MTPTPRRRRTWPCAALLLAACGDEPAAPGAGLPLLQHDFGVVRHGATPSHDFVIDPAVLGESCVPLAVHADCSCATPTMLLRARDGRERVLDGRPMSENAPTAGEVIVIRLALETMKKEARDLAPLLSKGRVVLQPVARPRPDQRISVPIEFRFGIDSPVVLQPTATLDFGEVPLSQPRTRYTTVRSDVPQPIRFGPARCTDPRIAVELREQEGGTLVAATFRPEPGSPAGAIHAAITVDTDLPEPYTVLIAAAGQTVPDLQVKPMNKVSLGLFDFEHERPEQFVLVTDHDMRRSPEFVLVRIVDAGGTDQGSHFAVDLEPAAGDPRTTRLRVRYLGGLPPGQFRGEILIAKDRTEGPFVPIELTAFHRPRP